MSDPTIQRILIILALVAATLLTRFLPFILFPAGKATPKYIQYLGKTLPYTTIGLLVVYCLKDVNMKAAPYGAAELIAILGIVILHYWKRNSLLSIGVGTALYMLLVQVVFT